MYLTQIFLSAQVLVDRKARPPAQQPAHGGTYDHDTDLRQSSSRIAVENQTALPGRCNKMQSREDKDRSVSEASAEAEPQQARNQNFAASDDPGNTSTKAYGLAGNVLSSLETFAQSVAGVAPSAAPAMTAAIVFSMAGNGAWLTYVISIGIVVLTAYCINIYAVRSSSPGSLYAYVTEGGGRHAGFISGWSMLLAYLLGVSACSIQFAVFAVEMLKEAGIHGSYLLPLLSSMCVLSTTWIACRNIKLSAEMMLWMEILSLMIITSLCCIALGHLRFQLDLTQVKLIHVSPNGICLGLVMAMFGFVGFESAATLGAEAKDPTRKIPQALLSSVLSAGLFFVFTTYAIVFAFREMPGTNLATCTTPLLLIADHLGLPWLGKLTNLGAAISFFACTLAATNAGARIMLAMAHDGFFHERIATTHPKNKTPTAAVIAASTCGLIPAMVLIASNHQTMDVVGWLGTLATYGYLVAYFLIAASCLFYLRRIGELKLLSIILAVLSGLATLGAFAGTMYPVPEGMYRWLPYVFLAYLTVGFLYCRSRRQKTQLQPAVALNTDAG